MKKILLIFFIAALYGCNQDNPVEPNKVLNYSGKYQTNIQDVQTVLLYVYHDGKMSLSGTGNWNGMTFNFAGTVLNKHAILNFSLKKTSLGDLEGTIDGFFDEEGKSLAGGYMLRNEYNILQNSISFKLIAKSNSY
ncbi:MAG: hypothetical protein AB1432_12960 [Bacteroidota bacterium]